MKVYSTSRLRVRSAKRVLTLGAAALLAIGTMAAEALDFGQGKGDPFGNVARGWSDAPGTGPGPVDRPNRFGELGSPGLERQSRFYGPGQHRVSGFSKAPSGGPGHSVHGPGAGRRGR